MGQQNTSKKKQKNYRSQTPEVALPLQKRTFKERFFEAKGEYGYLGFAMLIPAVIFFLIYLVRGLYPFGEGTVLVLDLNGQYVYFFEALRNTVLEGGSLLYSWSRALGGEFLGMYAYYIASPLSYLVCLFPKEYIQEFLLVLFMLKAALCGGTMAFYLHKHSVNKNKLTVIAFSVLYAVSAYCVVQQNNTMWIDAVMWLPLVAYGIEEIVKHGKYKVFVIFLALTLASNFYIGYMVCIFVLLYYFFYIFAYKDNFVNDPHREKLHFFKSILRVGFFSALAICIAAVIVLAAYYSLQFGKTDFTDPSWDITLRFDFLDLLFKMLPSSYDTVRINGLPFIYCGLLTVILTPAFFCSKSFTLREKICSAAFLLIFILSFMLSPLDLIWHGFQKPQWLNNRYSFMFCFFLIFLAFRAFDRIEEVSIKVLAFTSSLVFLFVAFLQKFAAEYKDKLVALAYGPNEEDFDVHPFATVLMTVLLLFIYVTLIALMQKVKNREMIAAVLVGVVCVEVFLSGLCNINDLDEDVGYTDHYKYSEFQTLFRPVTETVLDNDTSFYRMEKTYHRKLNDNMAMKIRGLSNSTSTLNADTIKFLNTMGYYSVSHKSQYKGGNVVSDSLLGIKYLISERDYSGIYGEPVFSAEDYAAHEGVTVDELKETTFSDYFKDLSSADINVYLNPYALSLAFAASDQILDLNMKDHCDNVDETDDRHNPEGYMNPFDRLNAFVTAILGEDETVEIFKPAVQNGDPVLDKGAEGTVSSKHNKYTGEDGTVTYSYTVPEDVQMYLYFPSFYSREIKLSMTELVTTVNEETGEESSKYQSKKIFDGTTSLDKCNERIVELGYSDSTDYKIKVTIDNTSGNVGQFYTKIQDSYLYYIDVDALEDAFTRIQEDQLVIEEYTEDTFHGKLSTSKDDQLILTTIPYDSGWKIYVDGVKVETLEASDTMPLVAFRIDGEGEHEITIKYRPTVIFAGMLISVSGIAAFALIIIFEKKLKRLKPVRAIFVVEDDPKNALKK